MDSEPLSPVGVFLACARARMDRLDFVAGQCQLSASKNPNWVADLIASLREDPLILPFNNAVAWLSRHGSRGALSASFASSICVEIQHVIDGIVIDRDWRAWWKARPHVAELLDAMWEHAAPLHTGRPEPAVPAHASPSPATPTPVSPSPAPPAPPPKPKPVTPSVQAVEPSPVTPAVARDSTPASADDERYAGIVRRLSDNARSMLRVLFVHEAFDCSSRVTLGYIVDELHINEDAVRVARRAIGKISPSLLETAVGNKGGTWLTPIGKRVASLIAPKTCFQAGLLADVKKGTNQHRKKHQ